MEPSTSRELTRSEEVQIREAVRELAWQWVQALSGMVKPPVHPFDADVLDAKKQQAVLLGLLRMLRRIGEATEELVDATVAAAGATHAGGQAIGDALMISRVRVRQRWPHAVAGRPGPRAAVPTLVGHEDWFGSPGDEVADRDWVVRARVRLLQDCATGGFGTPHLYSAGEQLTMVMAGRAGSWVCTDAWTTDGPPEGVLTVHADPEVVEMLEVLDVVSPWPDRELVLAGTSVGEGREQGSDRSLSAGAPRSLGDGSNSVRP